MLRTAPALLQPLFPLRTLRRASRRVASAGPGGAYRRSLGVQAAAAGLNGKGNVPLTQENVLVPFDAAAKDAERALAEARAIILSTRKALDATDPYARGADAGGLDSAELQLSAAAKALENLKASLAAVRGGRLPQVDVQQGVTAVVDAWSAVKAASALLTARPATAEALAAVTAALQRLSSTADGYTKKMQHLAREDPSSAFVVAVLIGGGVLCALGSALAFQKPSPPKRAAGGALPTAATVAKAKRVATRPAGSSGVQVQKAAGAAKAVPPPKPVAVKAAAAPAPVKPVAKAAPAAPPKPAVKAPPAATAPVQPAAAAKAPAAASPAKTVPAKAAASKVAAPKAVAPPAAPKVAPIPPPAAAKPDAPVKATPTVKPAAPVVAVKKPAAVVVPPSPVTVAPLRDVSGPSLSGRASYAFHNAFATPLSRAVLFASFALATVAAGGAAYSAASGAGLPAAALKAYSLLNNVPGATVDGPNTASKLTANALFVVGSFTFAVLIGLVGDVISTKATAVATSNAAIAEAGHTLVLGWNAAAGVMLRQLAAGPGGASTPVVILSTLPRHQVQAEVAAAFAHGQGPYPRVIVRTGSPVSETDLRAVCAGSAAHVVVLQPDHAEAGAPAALEADATKALALISLSPVKGVPPPRVTVEMKGPASEDFLTTALAARSRTGTSGAALVKRTTMVDARGSLARTLAACCTHTGLADVYSDGLAAAGEVGGLHCVPLPRGAVGKRFGDVWRQYKAPVAGFVRPGQHAFLAPGEGEVLRKGDVLVMYASTPVEAAARTWFAPAKRVAAIPAAAPAAHAAPAAAAQHKHILIAGLEKTGLADDLLRALGEDTAATAGGSNTTVTVLSSSLTRRDVGKWTNAKCRFSLVSGNAAKKADLLKAGAASADHVMLLAPPGVGDGDFHVTTLAALLQLQDIAVTRQQQQAAAAPVHVLLTVGGHQAASLAQRVAHCGGNALRLDVIDVHRLGAAAIAADVASRTESAAADALLHGRGGTGLALRPVSAYLGQQQGATNGWRLADAVREAGDVLIGWRIGDQRVAVATDRAASRVWGPADHVLVVKASPK